MLVIFSIKVPKPLVTRSPNWIFFYNTAVVLSYFYDSTIASWIHIFFFSLSLSLLILSLSSSSLPLSHLFLVQSMPPKLGWIQSGHSVGVAWRVEVACGVVRSALCASRWWCEFWVGFGFDFWCLTVVMSLISGGFWCEFFFDFLWVFCPWWWWVCCCHGFAVVVVVHFSLIILFIYLFLFFCMCVLLPWWL